jgi:hypothetical protein
MNERKLNSLRVKSLRCKQDIAEKLQICNLPVLSYKEIFRSAVSFYGEGWVGRIQWEMFGFSEYFTVGEQNTLKKYPLFLHLLDFIRNYEYQLNVWKTNYNVFREGEPYCWECFPQILFVSRSCGKLKIVEVLLSDEMLAGTEILLNKSAERFWVLRFVSEDFRVSKEQKARTIKLIQMTPELAAGIEKKSLEWKEILGVNIEAYENIQLPGNLERIGLAEMVKNVSAGNWANIRIILAENSRLLLNCLEMTAIDELPGIQDLNSDIAAVLRGIRNCYSSMKEFVEESGSDVWFVDCHQRSIVRFHLGWWAEVYVKHPSVTFDYPVMMRSGFFFVRFVADWPQTEWLQRFIELAKNEENPKRYCL